MFFVLEFGESTKNQISLYRYVSNEKFRRLYQIARSNTYARLKQVLVSAGFPAPDFFNEGMKIFRLRLENNQTNLATLPCCSLFGVVLDIML